MDVNAKYSLNKCVNNLLALFCYIKLYLSDAAKIFTSLFPEFDDLEMCTSLSHPQDYEGGTSSWYSSNCSGNKAAYEAADESSVQHLVVDLRSQLTRCHKVIRGLQMRVRSLSATSDYASSLERPHRKVRGH